MLTLYLYRTTGRLWSICSLSTMGALYRYCGICQLWRGPMHLISSRIPRSGLRDLLNCNWIRRAWTFQELLLANDPVFICGNTVLEWEEVICALYCAVEYYGSFRVQVEDEAPGANLDNWRSLIRLWIDFPRPVNWNGNPVWKNCVNQSENITMKECIKSIAEDNSYHHRFSVLYLISASSLVCGIIGAIEYGLYKANNTLVLNLLLFFPMVFFPFWPLFDTISVVGTLLFGVSQGQLRDELDNSAPRDMDKLSAIITALRERVVTEAHDKAFALLGVLDAVGCSTSAVDYNQPLHQTYQL